MRTVLLLFRNVFLAQAPAPISDVRKKAQVLCALQKGEKDRFGQAFSQPIQIYVSEQNNPMPGPVL